MWVLVLAMAVLFHPQCLAAGSVLIDREVEGESMWVWVLTLAMLFHPSVPGSRVSPH